MHCQKIIKVAREVGTSTCLRHLRTCEAKARVDQMLNQMNSDDLSSLNASLKDWKFDQEKSRQELAYLIVVHSLPFSLVEYPRFRSFVNSLNPCFEHISRTTIKSYCMGTYEKGKSELLEVLKSSTSRVSLTADLWTSKQTLGYLCVTCHFIRNWKLHKMVIKFGTVETPHDGRNLFNAMLKCLNEWSIKDKVFSITLDNASVNNNFVSTLRENLVAKCLLPSKGTMFHCRCTAHILNLIVQEGLLAMSNAVTSIRDSVKYVKSSQGRKQRFEKMIKEVGISCDKRPPLDVPTRWNSTYHMLKCALEYERAFEALTREDSQYVHEPLVEEWKMAKKLCDILKTFCDATEVLSGSNYPTTSCIFDQFWEVKLLLEKESSNTDVMIAAMIHKMKEKLQKYWDICFLQICVPVILDPRFKLGFLKFRLSKCFGETSQYFPIVERTFRDLFDEYNSQSSDCTQDHANSVGSVETNVDRSNPWADWSLHQNLRQMRRVSELDKYLEAETDPTSAPFDILQYWKTSCTTYPILARMARDMLAVPASTVASESAFSSGEKVISAYRSRLTSKTVEALICLQDWIRGKGMFGLLYVL